MEALATGAIGATGASGEQRVAEEAWQDRAWLNWG